MDVFRILGGRPLFGSIEASGAKNAVLPIFAAALLTKERCTVRNVPDLSDVRFMGQVLGAVGATVELKRRSGRNAGQTTERSRSTLT